MTTPTLGGQHQHDIHASSKQLRLQDFSRLIAAQSAIIETMKG